ncbi:MAG TPA: GDSL-type esterase/lipase family protein [Actinomycetota bacterium]|nr:GDSL-type esterase/lipase family protein [Actinomycetota bacterium]
MVQRHGEYAPEEPPEERLVVRRLGRALLYVLVLFLVSLAAIAFALQVTPDQSVSTLGQTVSVGATAPTFSLSGPGELVLFGQSLPTRVEFVGPVRPRLVLTDITINEQVEALFAPGTGSKTTEVGEALARGFRRYVAWEIGFVALGAGLLLGAIAGWRGYGWKKTAVTILGGVLFVEVLNVGAIMVTGATAPDVLRGVGSLDELVGREAASPLQAASGPPREGVQAIVMGDSTAAGIGGPPLPDATGQDQACQRSTIAFAETFARVNEWNVENLGCGGATIADGILGPQVVGGLEVPPQLAVAKRAVDAETVIINIGANDLHWSSLVFLCAAADSCDNRALTAYFQHSLDRFTQDYYELLRQLTALPGDPLVLINQYYEPFDPALDCLASDGLTPEKIDVLLARLDTVNQVLANGAETFGYRSIQPDFTGHELCTDQSYVQGADEPAPLHPNARGHLAIALADERALLASSS